MEYSDNNFDKEAYAEARKQEMDEISAKLEKGVQDVFNGEGYKNYLRFCAKMPRYSINNQILIMMQNPDATMCQSYTGWKEIGRTVKKGERGIRILAPAPYKKEVEKQKVDESGKAIFNAKGEPVTEMVEVKKMGFKATSTFDISQTEGEPIPRLGVDELLGKVDGYEMLMEAIKHAVEIPVTFEDIQSGAKGYYSVEENRIAIKEGMSETQTVKTALHEASHAALHSRTMMSGDVDKKSLNQKETEAESVAFVVCQHYGIDTSDYSFGYVATWASDKEVPELKASLETIRRTASDLIVKIDDKVAELTNFKDITKEKADEEELPFDFPEKDQTESINDSSLVKKEKKTESIKKQLDEKKKKTKESISKRTDKKELEPAI